MSKLKSKTNKKHYVKKYYKEIVRLWLRVNHIDENQKIKHKEQFER